MSKGGHVKPSDSDDEKLSEIRRRWKGASLIGHWRSLPSAAREEVLADLEETSRELSASRPELARHYTAALDVLDVASADGALGLWSQSVEDVQWLLDEVSRLRQELESKRGAR